MLVAPFGSGSPGSRDGRPRVRARIARQQRELALAVDVHVLVLPERRPRRRVRAEVDGRIALQAQVLGRDLVQQDGIAGFSSEYDFSPKRPVTSMTSPCALVVKEVDRRGVLGLRQVVHQLDVLRRAVRGRGEREQQCAKQSAESECTRPHVPSIGQENVVADRTELQRRTSACSGCQPSLTRSPISQRSSERCAGGVLLERDEPHARRQLHDHLRRGAHVDALDDRALLDGPSRLSELRPARSSRGGRDDPTEPVAGPGSRFEMPMKPATNGPPGRS